LWTRDISQQNKTEDHENDLKEKSGRDAAFFYWEKELFNLKIFPPPAEQVVYSHCDTKRAPVPDVEQALLYSLPKAAG
jgi:hypothetical protein